MSNIDIQYITVYYNYIHLQYICVTFILVAKQFGGEGSLNNMRDTIVKHVLGSKDVMFQKAKEVMLDQLSDLMVCNIL